MLDELEINFAKLEVGNGVTCCFNMADGSCLGHKLHGVQRTSSLTSYLRTFISGRFNEQNFVFIFVQRV